MSQEIIDNFRGKLWRIICKVDDLKNKTLDEYSVKRTTRMTEQKEQGTTSTFIEEMPICNSPTEIFDYLKLLYT